MVLYAKDIVETGFLSLSAGTNVLEGARAMKDSRHGFAVIGAPNRPEGMVTEWDILAKVVAEGRDPSKVTLGEIMSKELVAVEADAGLSVVSQMMTEKGVRRLLVQRGGEVIGVITAKTMLARMNEYVDKVSSQISKMQTPWF
jgi:malate dehydrogenase (oxaloacetate-decarboxylating)